MEAPLLSVGELTSEEVELEEFGTAKLMTLTCERSKTLCALDDWVTQKRICGP